MVTDLPPHDWHAPIIVSVVNAYCRFGKARYLEIGIDQGHTFADVVRGTNAVCWGVDITLDNFLYPLLKSNPRVRLWEESSDQFFDSEPLIHRDSFDVIFIDGDHSAGQVWNDLVSATGMITDDGTIILHDTMPLRQEWVESHCSDAYKTVERLTGIFKTSAALHTSSMIQVWTLPLFPGLTFVSKQYRPILND